MSQPIKTFFAEFIAENLSFLLCITEHNPAFNIHVFEHQLNSDLLIDFVQECIYLYKSEDSTYSYDSKCLSAFEKASQKKKTHEQEFDALFNAIVKQATLTIYLLLADASALVGVAEDFAALSKGLSALATDNPDAPVLHINPFTFKPLSTDRTVAYRKAADPKTFVRIFRKQGRKAKELSALLAGEVGKGVSKYASKGAIVATKDQKKKNQEFLKKSFVYDAADGSARPLAEIGNTDKKRDAQRLVFLKAVERLAQEAKLKWAMLTLTLPAEYHPNPTTNTKVEFNGVGFDEQQKIMAEKWKLVRSVLAKDNVKLSGVRVHEPHADGTPHWHILFFYDTEEQLKAVQDAVLMQFPDKLRVRSVKTPDFSKFTDKSPLTYTTCIYRNLDSLRKGVRYYSVPKSFYHFKPYDFIARSLSAFQHLKTPVVPKTFSVVRLAFDAMKVPCQVQLDIGAQPAELSGSHLKAKEAFNKKIAKFSSYVSKYVMKHSFESAEEDAPQQDTLFEQSAPKSNKNKKKLNAEKSAQLAVDANRSTWGLRSFQFFGIPQITQKWSLLRQIKLKDEKLVLDPVIRELAAIAQQPNGEGAYELMHVCGGLSVSPTPVQYRLKGLFVDDESRFGEAVEKIVGVKVENPEGVPLVKHAVKTLTKSIQTKKAVDALQAARELSSERETLIGGNSAPQLVQLGLTVTHELTGTISPFLTSSLAVAQQLQQKAIRADASSSHALIAAAGSGKTYTLVQRIKYLILQQGVKPDQVLAFSFTKESSRELLKRANDAGIRGVSCTTMHSKAGQLLKQIAPGFDINCLSFDEYFDAFTQRDIQSGSPNKGKYHILIDEAQDLNESNYAFLQYLAQTIYAVGDFRQSIYRWRNANPELFSQFTSNFGQEHETREHETPELALFDKPAQKHDLTTTFRNRHAVNAFANGIAHFIDTNAAFSASLDTADFGKVERQITRSDDEEYQAVKSYLLSADVNPDLPNAVICRTRRLLQYIKSRLNDDGVALERTEEDGNKKTLIALSTVHASKGLEFHNVVIANGSRTEIEDDLEFANVAYVAATRASGNLFLTSQGQLPRVFVDALTYIGQFSQYAHHT